MHQGQVSSWVASNEDELSNLMFVCACLYTALRKIISSKTVGNRSSVSVVSNYEEYGGMNKSLGFVC